MKISGFVEYVKQIWKNKPDTSTPVSAERLNHIEEGIKANSDALAALAAVVCDQVLNDPEKIASLAALYSVDKKIGDTSNLPNSAMDVVTALTTLNSNLFERLFFGTSATCMQSPYLSDVAYRMQISASGKAVITKTSDGGSSWVTDREIHTSDNIRCKGTVEYKGSSSNADNLDDFLIIGSGTNYPDSGFWYVMTLVYNSNNKKQIAYGYKNNNSKTRYCDNGIWSSWA